MNSLKRSTLLLLPIVLGAPLAACGSSQAPQELVDARAAYSRAQSSYAKDLSPASLHEAQVALQQAEKKFSDDGASDATKDAAYVAERKAQFAEAQGTTEHYQRELQAAKQRQNAVAAKSAEKTESELAATREQLEAEKTAREQAEQRANQALEQLAAATAGSSVKHEQRGTVITIPDQVLFGSGKSTLLPGAQNSLDKVADALKGEQNVKIEIDGHTDSRGSDATNQQLSTARANAVMSYLASKGVPKDEMTAIGFGSTRPLADNATTEGRAQNRRVEIVVQNKEPR